MAWEHLSVNKPHLVYILLGAFTTLFMLVSSIIKERAYIGEATVATIFGVIFGPYCANLINPDSWGNQDQITLEFSRVVLVVQCFAVGVELPKAYMERHWRSITFLLIPVMTFGWLVTSLFIWAMFYQWANWLDCLCMAACVTATDPVLASSVVGKGKFAKRVPKHLRDLLSCESGCNDGMAFPFVYLAVYVMRYKGHPHEVALHWFCYTILYECLFGAIFGVAIGYAARRAIRLAHEKDWIDRESFLVFYFVLALFCAGSGSMLGMDDLLVGFACGVGFSNDGWFTEKTEEAHVSNVIDLLINLTFFVYFGTIIPWNLFNVGHTGLDVWRLVVIAILVLFFRRIPIMLVLKPIIPDIKTWREALFAGHFGPIGVGALFVAILARAELETESTTPLAEIPDPPFPHANVIELIWPITTFLVITSILVHGSSIAVFTLGKHINTLTLTMSYTKAQDDNTWMDRLPRIQSRSKSQMSRGSDTEFDEKLPPGQLPTSVPGGFLRRQKEEDNPSRAQSRSSSQNRSKKRKAWEAGQGPGGPVSQSAIAPQPRISEPYSRSDSDTLAQKESDSPHSSSEERRDRGRATSPGEIYEEGDKTVFEDEEGNVLAVESESGTGESREESEIREGKKLMHKEGADHNAGVAPTKDDPNEDPGHELAEKVGLAEPPEKQPQAQKAPERPGRAWREGLRKMSTAGMLRKGHAGYEEDGQPPPKPEKKHGPARAYQFGNTIIVEDEDGEVIKKYDIPAPAGKQGNDKGANATMARLGAMGKKLGIGARESGMAAAAEGAGQKDSAGDGVPRKQSVADAQNDDDDIDLRFTTGGRRMSKVEFINSIRDMDPKRRIQAVEQSNAPEAVKQEARKEARERAALNRSGTTSNVPIVAERPEEEEDGMAALRQINSNDSENNELRLIDSGGKEVPVHNVASELKSYSMSSPTGETAAERRRRQALDSRLPHRTEEEEDSEDDGTERVPPAARRNASPKQRGGSLGNTDETAAERRRREGALGIRREQDSDSEEDEMPREPPPAAQRQGTNASGNIRFADPPTPTQSTARQSTLTWGKDRRQ